MESTAHHKYATPKEVIKKIKDGQPVLLYDSEENVYLTFLDKDDYEDRVLERRKGSDTVSVIFLTVLAKSNVSLFSNYNELLGTVKAKINAGDYKSTAVGFSIELTTK